jgi:hypothetical protein
MVPKSSIIAQKEAGAKRVLSNGQKVGDDEDGDDAWPQKVAASKFSPSHPFDPCEGEAQVDDGGMVSRAIDDEEEEPWDATLHWSAPPLCDLTTIPRPVESFADEGEDFSQLEEITEDDFYRASSNLRAIESSKVAETFLTKAEVLKKMKEKKKDEEKRRGVK